MKMICPIAKRGDCITKLCDHKTPHDEIFVYGDACKTPPKNKECACCVLDTESAPSYDGYWFVNDVRCYGWTPVQVRGNTFFRPGVRDPEEFKPGQYEWIKIDMPS